MGIIRDMATVGCELFLLLSKKSTIQVNDTRNFTVLRHILVPAMGYPWSIAACVQHNCLYISGPASKCTHRIALSNNSITTWELHGTPYFLSVTRNHTVLSTMRNSRKICECTTHGDLVREINLVASIDQPRYAFEHSASRFVVSFESPTQHRVCVVDTSGHIIHSYNQAPSTSSAQLKAPCSLAVNDHGNVFVVYRLDDRVQMLSSKLAYLGDVIISGEKLKEPQSIHFDEARGRLYIAEASGRLIVASLITA